MQPLGVALVGHAFMGRVHSQAWRTVGRVFPQERPVERTVLAGVDAARARRAADELGWRDATDNWKEAVLRDDVHIVDICTPGDSHADIAIAALEAGKHVLCEKPLATTVAEAGAMAVAARRARERGVRSMAGFTYRRVPALTLARQLIQEDRLGRVLQFRARYLQDWLHDPDAPFSWRLDRARAGAGALGDTGSHLIDLGQYLLGDTLDGVSAQLATFVDRRHAPDGTPAQVTVDAAAVFIARFGGGTLATFEASRFAAGRKNAIQLEISGTKGALSFDFESMNELSFYDATEPSGTAGFRRILVTEPDHPYLRAWWPAGHGLGYEHAFTHQAHDLLTAIRDGTDPAPGFEQGLYVQQVIEAVEASAANAGVYTPIATS
ncbi:Gfo/Idh/MocA family oxidoreductase [Streptomyces sp. KM273126]|uniref:Gfo/Idh/MocA family protein n=1 Tax=Streptomyces sp. KM273126 TaxID=2545247 RepID=UPI00103EF0D5|nr:Gfo/Idh/MocA family oxidoreductase [Streptomyces sp. KM273126]MBA2810951.1 Gfo/Idh/MocA family oxidoreductase [Streptomyces sp. KM273126]